MTRPVTTAASAFLDPVRVRALLVGGVLGCVAWALSTGPNAGTYQFAMALVVIVAGSGSFVAFALHERRATLRESAAALRTWVCALGAGVCVAMPAMQHLLG